MGARMQAAALYPLAAWALSWRTATYLLTKRGTR